MDRVSFTLPEARFFSKSIPRLKKVLEAAATKDAGVLERSTYKTLNAMTEKAIEAGQAEAEPVPVMLNRKQRLIVRDLIRSVLRNLVTQVIPEYERRAAGTGDVDVNNYAAYLESSKQKVEILEKMARKLK